MNDECNLVLSGHPTLLAAPAIIPLVFETGTSRRGRGAARAGLILRFDLFTRGHESPIILVPGNCTAPVGSREYVHVPITVYIGGIHRHRTRCI